MHFCIFETALVEEKANVAEAFYKNLVVEVAKQDGLVGTTGYLGSPQNSGRSCELSVWRDEAAIVGWRRHPGHQRAMKAGRDAVFQDYRLRIGYTIPNPAETEELSSHMSTITSDSPPLHKPIIVIYKRPQNESEPIASYNAASLLDASNDSYSLAIAIGEPLESSSYLNGTHAIWFFSWPSIGDAQSFGSAIRRVLGDELHFMKISREYSDSKREEAPNDE